MTPQAIASNPRPPGPDPSDPSLLREVGPGLSRRPGVDIHQGAPGPAPVILRHRDRPRSKSRLHHARQPDRPLSGQVQGHQPSPHHQHQQERGQQVDRQKGVNDPPKPVPARINLEQRFVRLSAWARRLVHATPARHRPSWNGLSPPSSRHGSPAANDPRGTTLGHARPQNPRSSPVNPSVPLRKTPSFREEMIENNTFDAQSPQRFRGLSRQCKVFGFVVDFPRSLTQDRCESR